MTSRWRVEATDEFDREYMKLDRAVQRRVLAYLHEVERSQRTRSRSSTSTRSTTAAACRSRPK